MFVSMQHHVVVGSCVMSHLVFCSGRVMNYCSILQCSIYSMVLYILVATYPFDDHNAPPIEMMGAFCLDVDSHLKSHPENIVVIHCKAGIHESRHAYYHRGILILTLISMTPYTIGKGRTGVMVCAYLLHSGMWSKAEEALQYYGAARTKDAKVMPM